LRNEALYYLASSPNIYRHLVWKPEERDGFEGLRVGGREILKWIFKKYNRVIDLAQDWDTWRSLVNTVMNMRVQYNADDFPTTLGTVSLSRRSLLHGD
jgi:hypothetical protein